MGVVNFLPIQDGTGDASPSNIRPIRAPLDIDGIGKVYGGSLDTVTGELVNEWYSDKISSRTWNFRPDYTYPYFVSNNSQVITNTANVLTVLCECYQGIPNMGAGTFRGNDYNHKIISNTLSGNTNSTLQIQDHDISTPKELVQKYGDYLFCAKRRETKYLTYHLTTAQLHQTLAQLKTYFGGILPVAKMPDIRRRIIMDSPHIVTPTPAELHTFSTDMAAPLKDCVIHFEPVQEGEGDPSPENVRNITGWTGMELTRCGVNIFDGVMENGDINSQTGQNNGTSTSRYRSKNYVPITVGRYYFHDPGRTGTVRVFSYKADKSFRGFTAWDINDVSEIFSADADYIRFRFGSGMVADDAQISINSDPTITEYVPYTGITLPIIFPTEAGILYGGTYNPVTGELVAEWIEILCDGTETNWHESTYNRYYRGILQDGLAYVRTSPANIMCDKLKPIAASGISGSSSYRCYTHSTTSIGIQLADGVDLYEWLAANPIKIINKLATPIVYHLPPLTLKTLKGINNIWSNANGNIDLSYWTH